MSRAIPQPRHDDGSPAPEDNIAKCKRILAAVDAFHDNPTQAARSDLRNAIYDELARVAADLLEEKSALVTALQWRGQFDRRPGEGYTECFERIAEVFRRETGYMRPGKDASPQAGQSIDERQAAWEEWIEAGLARARAAITKATGSTT